jgi:hypothetical protein
LTIWGMYPMLHFTPLCVDLAKWGV